MDRWLLLQPLHFTDKVLNKLDAQGVRRREVTLHVGAGTFQPVQGNTFDQHTMHAEFISVDTSLLPELIASLGQITAVGTTTYEPLKLFTGLAIASFKKETFHPKIGTLTNGMPIKKQKPDIGMIPVWPLRHYISIWLPIISTKSRRLRVC
jgi:hypothetical protein